MSYSRNLIANFYARDHGVSATLNQINGGLSNTSRMAAGSGQAMGFYEKQLRAVGTTLRYAFAGEVIQQMRMAIQNLEQFQEGIANIAAIGTQQNGLPLVQGQLDELGRQAIRTSIQTGRAAGDILNTYRSLYSSLQHMSMKDVGSIGNLLTMGAQISETDPRTLGGALIGAGQVFDPTGMEKHPAQVMTKMANEFFTVIKRSINMTGDELAKQYGRVVPFARTARLSPEEMNALIVMSSRGGGTAAMFNRNLGQLLSRLQQPASGMAAKAYQRIGLGPEERANMGGLQVLRRILLAAMTASGVKPLSRTEINRLSATPAGQARLREIVARQGEKATTGRGGQLLAEIFGGRMQSRQAFSVLAPMMGVLNDEVNIQRTNAEKLHLIQDNFNRWLDQNPLMAMSTAIHGFTTDVLSYGNPLFRQLARWTRGLTLGMDDGLHAVNKFNQHMDRAALQFAKRHGLTNIPGVNFAAKHFAGGTEGLLAGAIAASVATGVIPGLDRFRKSGLKIAEAPMMAEAAASALAGVANGQMAAPLWVVIHPLSWALMPGGFGKGSSDIPTPTPSWWKRLGKKAKGGGAGVEKDAAEATKKGVILRAAPKLLKVAKVAGPAAIIADYLVNTDSVSTGDLPKDYRRFHPYYKGSDPYGLFRNALKYGNRLPGVKPGTGPGERQWAMHQKPYVEGMKYHRELMALLQTVAARDRTRFMPKMALSDTSQNEKIAAALDLDITIRDSHGKVVGREARQGVPTTFWRDGNPPPNHKGQKRTQRTGN